MSLIDQIFEQSKLGTAQDPSANPFAGGVALGQHQQQINMELATLPLKQTLMQQDAQLNSAKIEQVLSSRQAEIDTEEQLAGLAGRVQHAFTEASPTDAIPFLFEALQKTPRLAENPHFHQLWKDTQTSIQAATLAKHYDDLSAANEARIKERRFHDMPKAAQFEDLAKEAEAAGNPDTARMYREHADLEVQREERLQQQQADIHERNQIRLKQLETSLARTEGKGAFAVLQSQLRNIENAPRMTIEDRKKASDALFEDYEKKYGASSAGAVPPPAPSNSGFKIKVVKP